MNAKRLQKRQIGKWVGKLKLTNFTPKLISINWCIAIAALYTISVLYRCGLAIYAKLYSEPGLFKVSEILNNEPTILFIPISIYIFILSWCYLFWLPKHIEKYYSLFFLIASSLSISRIIITYTFPVILYLNFAILLFAFASLFTMIIAKKRNKRIGVAS